MHSEKFQLDQIQKCRLSVIIYFDVPVLLTILRVGIRGEIQFHCIVRNVLFVG